MLAFQLKGSNRAKIEHVASTQIGAFAHENRIRAGSLLKSGRHVYRITRNQKILSSELRSGSCHITRVDAYTHLQPRRRWVMLQASSIEAIERCLHIQRRADSPVRIIFVRNGCAEYRHHRISDIFLNGAAMPPY